MKATLLCLHGFTMNGAGLLHMMGELVPRLEDVFELAFPDAPHTASEDSARAIGELLGGPRAKPPNLEWWNASEDRREYRGWGESLARLREEAARHASLCVFGFSQGAAVAAALAALSAHEEFPRLGCAVLVAGFAPRAMDIEASFTTPIDVPSLHVWGQADPFAKHGPSLLSKFAPESRRELVWPGRHSIPTRGEAADRLVEFLRRHATDAGAAPAVKR